MIGGLTPLIPLFHINTFTRNGRGGFARIFVPIKTPDDKPFVSKIPAIPLRPILFKMAFATSGSKRMGRPLPMRIFGTTPLPATKLFVTGITKDSAGAVLGSCSVALYRTSDDVLIQRAISDATTGAYSFSPVGAVNHYVVAYKAGSPDVAGTTVNTLVGQ